MIFNSIRWRLQAWHGLLLLVVLTGFGLTAYQVAWNNQLRRIDQELEQRLGTLFRPPPPERPFPGEPRLGPPPSDQPPHKGAGPDRFESRNDPVKFREKAREWLQKAASVEANQTNGVYFVIWQSDGSVLARSSGSPALVPMPSRGDTLQPPLSIGPRPGPEHFTALRSRGELREAFRFMPFGDCLLVGHSLAPDLAAMRRLAAWLFAAGGAVLVFGLAGGWWLATRAIQPIQDISATAAKIAAGDLSQRIDTADTENELGRLATVLNSTFARLEAAFAHQARFTSDASHELRTPVSVILAQTQTALSRERAAPEYRQALEACQRAAQRMGRLSQSLLELARLDAGQEPMKREPFDLSRVARECVELVRPVAAELGLELLCELPATDCVGDDERISQVVTNLLTNAIQYNCPKGQVRIAVRPDDRAAVLTVSDTGEGISAEDLPHIFERFYRVDKSRSRIQGRTGLGLAICKAIVDAHSGTIEVHSRSGEGSVFRIRLPLS